MSRQLVEAWFGAFREKDILKLERVLADDFVHTSPYGEIKGKAVYIGLVRDNEDAFFKPTIQIQDVLTDGDASAVRYLVDGKPACDCIYGRNGQIVRIYSYYHVGKKPVL